MISGLWVEVVALAGAFIIAAVTTPGGVSGAVLLPFQVSVLGTPSPWVTPTNLLHMSLAVVGSRPPGKLREIAGKHFVGYPVV